MTSYITEDEFRARTVVPGAHVDDVMDEASQWLATNLEMASRHVDGRLRKRYTVPFLVVPECVKEWVVGIVAMRLYLRRGIDPTDPSWEIIKSESDRVSEELKEAANSEVGLWDLPDQNLLDASGITKTGTRAYVENSPFIGVQKQSIAAINEMEFGDGTYL